MSRIARVVVAAALCAALLPGSGPGAGAQEPDPLVRDSLAALSGLVEKPHCTAKDALDGDAANGIDLPYVFCDDGVPAAGGGERAIPVPVKYRSNAAGDDWSGLPKPATVEEAAAAAAVDDLRPERGNRISLDVDITLPPSATMKRIVGADVPTLRPPPGGYPVVVFMHGCCGGNKTSWEAASVDANNEQWHHSNSWFASRGYVVVNYTARGFRDNQDRGSTGTTQLNSRRYEINDYQYLVGLLADHDAMRRAEGKSPLFKINPSKVAAVGGSYGGGFAWLALTDPTWKSPQRNVRMRLGAVVTKYGWTDLVESLVPSGHYFDRNPNGPGTFVAPTDPRKALSRDPIGVEKQSIVAGLYATGNLATGNHTTFPDYMHDAYARLQVGEPYDNDPNLERVLESFLRDRSAYFQERFWTRVDNGLKVPLYAAATWTDPLFPTMETVRFYNKLRRVDPEYPITMYLGDYQHFAQNKPKEWDDLCGTDHHVCQVKDFTRADGSINLMRTPARVRVGINTRMNRFLDFHMLGRGRRPASDVSATTTVCFERDRQIQGRRAGGRVPRRDVACAWVQPDRVRMEPWWHHYERSVRRARARERSGRQRPHLRQVLHDQPDESGSRCGRVRGRRRTDLHDDGDPDADGEASGHRNRLLAGGSPVREEDRRDDDDGDPRRLPGEHDGCAE